MTTAKLNVLVLEPGFKAYKEPVLKAMHDSGRANLIIATGLQATIDCAWAKKYAAGWIEFSYSENTLLGEVSRYLEREKIALDGICSYVESSVHFANALQHALGLPVISNLTDKSIRSKALMRERLARAGVHQPNYAILNNRDELEKFLATELRFPLVVKPAELMSSLAVRLVHDRDALIAAYEKAATADFWDENLRGLYGDMLNQVLVEEYIEGQEYSAEVVVQDGRARLLGVTKKFTTQNGFFDELGHLFPAPEAEISPATRDAIVSFIECSHEALGLRNTLTHPEFRLRDCKPVAMEINCRLGGDLISSLVEKSTGLNIGELLLDVCTGKLASTPALKPARSHNICFLTSGCDGRVLAAPSLGETGESFEMSPYVGVDSLLFKNDLNATSRLGHVIFTGEAPEARVLDEQRRKFEIQQPVMIKALERERDWIMVFEARSTDLDAMTRIENETWHQSLAASPELIRKRLEINPCSALICYSARRGEPVGFISMLPVDDLYVKKFKPWSFYSGLAVTPDYFKRLDKIQCQYVISITAHPDAPRGTATALVQGATRWCAMNGVPNLMYGIRVPSFARVHGEKGLDFDAYFDGLLKREYHEDIFKVALNAGGRPLGYLSDYYEDPESCNYGVIIIHNTGHEMGRA